MSTRTIVLLALFIVALVVWLLWVTRDTPKSRVKRRESYLDSVVSDISKLMVIDILDSLCVLGKDLSIPPIPRYMKLLPVLGNDLLDELEELDFSDDSYKQVFEKHTDWDLTSRKFLETVDRKGISGSGIFGGAHSGGEKLYKQLAFNEKFRISRREIDEYLTFDEVPESWLSFLEINGRVTKEDHLRADSLTAQIRGRLARWGRTEPHLFTHMLPDFAADEGAPLHETFLKTVLVSDGRMLKGVLGENKYGGKVLEAQAARAREWIFLSDSWWKKRIPK